MVPSLLSFALLALFLSRFRLSLLVLLVALDLCHGSVLVVVGITGHERQCFLYTSWSRISVLGFVILSGGKGGNSGYLGVPSMSAAEEGQAEGPEQHPENECVALLRRN